MVEFIVFDQYLTTSHSPQGADRETDNGTYVGFLKPQNSEIHLLQECLILHQLGHTS